MARLGRARRFPPIIKRATVVSVAPPTAGTLAFTSTSDAGPKLTWTAFSGGNGSVTYYVHRSTTSNFTPSGTTPGSGTCIAAAASSPYTDGTAAGSTKYYYKVVGTDATPSSATTNQAAGAKGAAVVNLLCIGDSTTSGTGASAGQDWPTQVGLQLAKVGGPGKERVVNVSNQAVSGSTSGGWVSGQTNYNTAKAAGLAQGTTDLAIMLGVNDATAGTPVAAATYKSNLQDTITNWLVDVPTTVRVYVLYPTSLNALSVTSEAVLDTYLPQIDSLDNGTTIFARGKLVNTYTAEHPAELNGDFVHPTAAGYLSMAATIAADIEGVLVPATTGGGTAGSRLVGPSALVTPASAAA